MILVLRLQFTLFLIFLVFFMNPDMFELGNSIINTFGIFMNPDNIEFGNSIHKHLWYPYEP